MKVCVAGGREYDDEERVRQVLDDLHAAKPITQVMTGGCRGADAMAERWARARGVEVRTFAADWKTFGRHAGPIRNAQMLAEGYPILVVAFPGGKGTANLVGHARRRGLQIVEVA